MQAMDLKYQLPSDPTVYVDLLDDEDVQLMFDEVGCADITIGLIKVDNFGRQF